VRATTDQHLADAGDGHRRYSAPAVGVTELADVRALPASEGRRNPHGYHCRREGEEHVEARGEQELAWKLGDHRTRREIPQTEAHADNNRANDVEHADDRRQPSGTLQRFSRLAKSEWRARSLRGEVRRG
jgi:hypothetical protein